MRAVPHWVHVKNPKAPEVKGEEELERGLEPVLNYLGGNTKKGALTRIMNEGPRFLEGKNLNSAGLGGNNFTRVRNQAGHPIC
jgi:hypothetical protein